jgi:hypothetical protein
MELESVKVFIGTPYLIENPYALMKLWGVEGTKDQIEDYGYDPINVISERILTTNKGRVVEILEDDNDLNKGHFSIFGCTESMEEVVSLQKGMGIIVARYSCMYGDVSEYSQKSPEESGYSLDIPKFPEVARAFMTDDAIVSAIMERDMGGIEEAVKELNKKIHLPIFITPYLERALSFR